MSHTKYERAPPIGVHSNEMNVADGTLGLENHDGSVKLWSKSLARKYGPKNLDRIFSSHDWNRFEPECTGT